MPRKGKNGNIYSTPRKAVFCNRCGGPCGMYPTGKSGLPKLSCDNCSYLKCQRLTVISAPRLNLHSGVHGEGFTYAMPVVSKCGESGIATITGNCQVSAPPI